MREETVHYLNKKEEALVHLLTELGINKNVASVLVFLAGTPEATSRDIEHGTGLRQPEISVAVKHLIGRGWIRSRPPLPEHTGRRTKVYELARPFATIATSIEKEKKEETDRGLALVKRLHNYLP